MSEVKRSGGPPPLEEIDILEHGAPRAGVPQQMDRRLFMLFQAFQIGGGADPERALRAFDERLRSHDVPGVIYEDATDPLGLGLLTWSEDPEHFVSKVRALLNDPKGPKLLLRPEFTMLGRTYSSGYEQDLEHMLLRRPVANALNPEASWAVWYPLRRSGKFAELEAREQGAILREHATIGRSYGAGGHAQDIRLACHGLDKRDNEFIIGVTSDKLHRLSHLIERMRRTKQTSEYIAQMGPFFVGRVAVRFGGSGS